MSTTAQILDAIEAKLITVSGLSADQVKVGRQWPGKGEHRVYVNVVPIREEKEEIDGGEVNAKLNIGVACIVRIDESQAQTQWKQLNTTWSNVELALEDLMDDNVGGKACKMVLDAGGSEWDSFDDKDQMAVAGATYTIEFERALGTGA